MEMHKKLQAALDKLPIKQADIARSTRINTGKISLVFKGETSSMTYLVPIVKAMGVSFDWLFDEERGLPPVFIHEKVRSLTKPEEEVLFLAHKVSRGDENPSELSSAQDRLIGLPEGKPVRDKMPPMIPRSDDDRSGTHKLGQKKA